MEKLYDTIDRINCKCEICENCIYELCCNNCLNCHCYMPMIDKSKASGFCISIGYAIMGFSSALMEMIKNLGTIAQLIVSVLTIGVIASISYAIYYVYTQTNKVETFFQEKLHNVTDSIPHFP